MTISVRGSAIAYINNAAAGAISLPPGSAAGDLCVLFVAHGLAPNYPPFGGPWETLDSSQGSNVNGSAYQCVLTAAQIAAGSISIGFAGQYYGALAAISFVGPLAGDRTIISLRNSTGASPRTLTTDTTPIIGDYAIYFGFGRFNGTVSSSAGSGLQTLSNTGASAVLAGNLLASAGAVSDTFSFSATPACDYEIIVVVSETPKAGLNLRAPLVLLEDLSEGAPAALRAALVALESLDEGYPNLRCALLILESLHPVPPEGNVSTQLFPGSMGAPSALPGLAFSFHKRPTFSTSVYKGASGVSARRANMQYPIWEFELSFEFLRDKDSINSNEYRTLCGFFMQRLGGFDTFLLKDPDDYNVVGGAMGTADGVTTQFYFKRTMGGFAEKVGQVDNGHTINVYDNGVLKTAGVDYTLTLPNSVVFTTAPTSGHAITADFQFFFNCRFQDDTADFDKFADKFWELQKITLETVPQ